MVVVGIVDGVNISERTIRIFVPDKDNAVFDNIIVCKNHEIPNLNEPVACVFTKGQQGFLLGSY